MNRNIYTDRVRRLFKQVPKGVNVIFVQHGGVVRYLTGSIEGTAVLRRNRIEIVSSLMSEEGARESGFPVHVFTRDNIEKVFRKMFRGARKVGYLEAHSTIGERRNLRKRCGRRPLADVTRPVNDLAAVKDEAELRCLRKACRIASDTAGRVPGMLEEGMTELDLLREILCSLQRSGGDGTSFGGIVGFGANTSHPHAVTGRRRLRKGQFVMVDFGTTINGYGSDITRTFCFGKASRKQRDMYKVCYDAQRISFDMIRDGKGLADINTAVSDHFVKHGYPEFIHSIGHSLGLVGSGFVNKPGAVNTVEPGIYLAGYGGVRIEDDILIRKNHSLEFLTSMPSDRLIEV